MQATFPTAGERTVRLRITDDHGVQRITPRTFTVRAPEAVVPPSDPKDEQARGGGQPEPQQRRSTTPAAPAPGAAVIVASAPAGTARPAASTGNGKVALATKRRCRTVKARRKGRVLRKRVCTKTPAKKSKTARKPAQRRRRG